MRDKLILLVEDDPHDEALALRALKKHAVEASIVVVRDGAEALDFLFGAGVHADRDPTATPSVVLLDLNLPKIGGLDVLRRLRSEERTSMVPVVVLTSSDERNDVVAVYAAGGNSFVTKPIEYEAYSQALASLGSYWTNVNVPPPSVDQKRRRHDE